MINKKLSRPKIMSDAFSRNMKNTPAEDTFVKAIMSGHDEYGAHEVVMKKYGKIEADKVFNEAKMLEKESGKY